MNKSKFVGNLEILPEDKMEALSPHGEIKESFSSEPSDRIEVLKREQEVPSAETEPEVVAQPQESVEKPLETSVELSEEVNDSREETPIPKKSSLLSTNLKSDEAKKVILLVAVPDTSNQKQKLNETLPVKTPNVEQNHMKPRKEEPNPKENSTETSVKSQAPAQEQNEAKESTEEKDETSNMKSNAPIKDHQQTGTKLNVAKKTLEEKLKDVDKLESYKKNRAKEILMEEESRKTWSHLLSEVSQISAVSAFKLLFEQSSTSLYPDMSMMKRIYKKKLNILRENFAYRLGVLKQVKQTMREKYDREAQQLYSDYNYNKEQYRKSTKTHLKDSQESWGFW